MLKNPVRKKIEESCSMKTEVFIFSGSLWFHHQIKIEIIKINESFKSMSFDCENQFSLKPLHLCGELQFEVSNDFELSCLINCILRFFSFLWDTSLTLDLFFVRDLISGLPFDSIFLVFFCFSRFVFFGFRLRQWVMIPLDGMRPLLLGLIILELPK